MNTKSPLLLNKLKQKFIARREYCDLGGTIEFLGMYISYNHKNQKIFIDQYLNQIKSSVISNFARSTNN